MSRKQWDSLDLSSRLDLCSSVPVPDGKNCSRGSFTEVLIGYPGVRGHYPPNSLPQSQIYKRKTQPRARVRGYSYFKIRVETAYLNGL
jgi:hypothetical protein